MMLADSRKATLQSIHTAAVNKAVKDQDTNIVLDDLPHPINDSDKDLTRKERVTLAQLRSGYCRLLGSYKSRIKKDGSLNVCADCGKTPHDIKHLFVFPANLTTLIPSDLWRRPMDSIREFSYLEAGNLDWDEPRSKANNNDNIPLYISSWFPFSFASTYFTSPVSSSFFFYSSRLTSLGLFVYSSTPLPTLFIVFTVMWQVDLITHRNSTSYLQSCQIKFYAHSVPQFIQFSTIEVIR